MPKLTPNDLDQFNKGQAPEDKIYVKNPGFWISCRSWILRKKWRYYQKHNTSSRKKILWK
jgi:hypothetical protein